MKKTIITFVRLSLGFCLLAAAAAQSKPPSPQVKPKASAESSIPEEDKLRMRLGSNPHDTAARKRLIELLESRYAFRAIVNADADWLKNNPSDYAAMIEVCSTSEAALNDPEFAIAQLRSFLNRASRDSDPDYYDGLTDQLADKLARRGHVEESLTLFANLVRLNPNDAGFWAGYGNALSVLGRHSEAVKAVRRAIELDSSDDFFHQLLASVLLKSGDLAGAETEYKAALSLYESQYKKGESGDSLARGLIKIEAEHHEESALAERRLKLAHVLWMEKKYDDAIAQTKLAFDADQYEFIAIYVRANIYEAKGDAVNARKARDEAADAIAKEAAKEKLSDKSGVESGDPRIAFLTDALWNDQTGYPALPKEIVSILEPRMASLSTAERIALAMAYFGLNKVPDAKRQWEKAIEADPRADTSTSHANLGRELSKAGAPTDALPHLRRAYELDPQNLTYRMEFAALN